MRHALPVLLALLLLGAPTVRAEDHDLVTALLAWEPGTIGSRSAGRIPFKAEPPEGVTPLPDLRAGRYARIRMAGSEKGLLLAFDIDKENPRLWVDTDFDGELSDEKTSALGRSGLNFFRHQEVLAPYADESAPVPLALHFSHFPSKGSDYVTVVAHMYRRGTVVLGGRLRFLALADHSFDAAFDDEKRDRIYLDLDGDGKLQATGSAPERILPGTPFRVGDEGWTAHVVSRSGHAVEFRRVEAVPPATPREWVDTVAPAAGVKRTRPKQTFKSLLDDFVEERKKPYAERTATIQSLGALGTKKSLSLLLDVGTKDPDVNARNAALRALGNAAYLDIGGDRVLKLAQKATGSQAYTLAQVLHQMGHPKREGVFLRMLSSADSNAVSGAARHLAYMDSARGRKRILRVVRDHGTPGVRYSAYIGGARNLRGGPPIALMLAAAGDGYGPLQAEAIRDLGKLGHPAAARRALALAEERPLASNVGQALAEVLGARGDAKAVGAMLGFLEDEKLHATVRKKVLEQLRLLRAPKAIAVIVKGLKSKTPAVRAVAAEVLAAIPEPAVTKALLKQAKREKEADVLALLLEALGDHGDEQALPLLFKEAKRRKRSGARAAAVRALARVGFQHPKVRAFLIALLGSRDPESRILALDAAGAAGDLAVVAKVLPNLAHAMWQVRLAAVEALDALRPRTAVAPLIERLKLEEEERVRDALAATLFRLTGMNLYDSAEIWARWWAQNEESFVVPEAIPTLPEQHVGGTQAGFYGIPIKTERVVFVIDQSGSMSALGRANAPDDPNSQKSNNRLDVAVREVLGAIAKLKNRARVNVILFHTTIHPWKPNLQRLSGGNRNALRRHLESKRPTGGTNLYDGLELALTIKDVDTVFLLSDGSPGSGKYVATPDILRAVRRENQTRRIAIHCISIGMDSELLRLLARENGGRYVRR